MPITVRDELPAIDQLQRENVFVMRQSRAEHQDIRPLKLAILNLMPNKVETETQLIRLLSNSPLQFSVDLLQLDSHVSKNTAKDHLDAFYQRFSDVLEQNYDGLVVTGAPLGKFDYEQVDYWPELQKVFAWAEQRVTSSLFLCWGAHAALYHYYGITRQLRDEKLTGVFHHQRYCDFSPLVRGFDDEFLAPHSRYSQVPLDAIAAQPDLQVLAGSEQVGAYLVKSLQGDKVFITGHPEYDARSLANEYQRDLATLGAQAPKPQGYFTDDDPALPVKKSWHSHAFLLFSNWLNYYVYQATPFDIRQVSDKVRTEHHG